MRMILTTLAFVALQLTEASADPQQAPRRPGRAPAVTPPSRCQDVKQRRAQADELLRAGANDDAIAAYDNLLQDCGGRRWLRVALSFNLALAHKNRAERPIDAADPAESVRLRMLAIEDRRRAVALLREFLAGGPLGAAAEARAYIARLDADILEQSLLVTKERDHMAREIEYAQRREQKIAAARQRAASRRWRMRAGGLAAGAFSVTAFGVAAYYGRQAQSVADELSHVRDWTPEADAMVADGQRAESRMILFTTIGGASVAAAGLLYWLAWRDAEHWEALDRMDLTVTSNSVAASWSFR